MNHSICIANCLIRVRGLGEPEGQAVLMVSPSGEMQLRLDGYAIIPIEEYASEYAAELAQRSAKERHLPPRVFDDGTIPIVGCVFI